MLLALIYFIYIDTQQRSEWHINIYSFYLFFA